MEYLVTYGWALLALFVVVAYLIASGAFSANSFAAQECVFQPDLPCTSYIIYKSSGSTIVDFSLANGLGFPIELESVRYSMLGVGDENVALPSDTRYSSGEKISLSHAFSGGSQPQPRDFRSVQVKITYKNCRNLPCSGLYTTSGRVSAIVEGG